MLDLGDTSTTTQLSNYESVYDATFGRANSVVYPSLRRATSVEIANRPVITTPIAGATARWSTCRRSAAVTSVDPKPDKATVCETAKCTPRYANACRARVEPLCRIGFGSRDSFELGEERRGVVLIPIRESGIARVARFSWHRQFAEASTVG